MISDETQLQTIVGALMAQALDNTAQILLEELKRIIEHDVYSYEESWGGRTGQWGESFEKTASIIVGNIVHSRISQNYTTMVVDERRKSHVQREELSQIIESGVGYNFGYAPARPFWSTFDNYVDTNLDKIWIMECKKVGLDIRPIITKVLN